MTKRRALFEEVAADAPRAPVAAPGAAQARRQGARRAVAIWLWLLAALVVAMVLVGGMTRLTDSGLSITEWRPVTGAIPPLTAEDWQVEFDKYRQIPQYQLINRGMSLEEFKVIYWWEWGHRQFGRVIGLVWAVGYFGFLVFRRIPPGWSLRLLIPGLLGGVQGAIGWWMVASGLEGEMISVASYRLAVHLGLAFVILGLLVHYALMLGREPADLVQARRRRLRGPRGLGQGLLALTFLQIVLGALVAGIDAGRSYADWPLMGGEWFPSAAFVVEPPWRNFFESAGLVQFSHRVLGYLVFLLGLVWWVVAWRSGHRGLRGRAHAVMAVLSLQVVLGVVTVMQAAPWELAIVHQAGAIALWALLLRALFQAGWPVEERIARGRPRG